MVHTEMEKMTTIEAEKKDSFVKDNFQMFLSIVSVALYSADMLSRVRLFEPLWTVVHQAPLSMRFSQQEYRSGLPFPSPGGLPNPRIKPTSPMSPALQMNSLPLSRRGSLHSTQKYIQYPMINHIRKEY